MKVTMIPVEEVHQDRDEARVIVGPPEGHDPTGDIRSLEMRVARGELDGVPVTVFEARIVLDPGDLAKLADGEPIWLSFYSGVMPFDIRVGDD